MRRFLLTLSLLIAGHCAMGDDHVVVLLDTSGSMAERMRHTRAIKIDVAKQALQKVVDQMPAATQLGLLTFDNWAFPIGPVDKTKSQQSISLMRTGGGTPLGEYLKVAADSLLSIREKKYGVGTYTLLVVTDGESTDGSLMDEYTPDIVSRGITLKTIGLDLNEAHTLSRYSVSYFAADNPDALENALKKAVAELPVGNDQVEEDAYAMLSAIPDAMAPQLIDSLTNTLTLNQPIGEKPKVKLVDAQGNVTFVQTEVPVESGGLAILELLGILALVIVGIAGVFVLIKIFCE
jgi:uncharacterized protein YegL